MPWLPPETVQSLLWCAAGLVAAWVFLPPLFTMLGQTRVTFTIVGGPDTLQPTNDDPQYADLYERLCDQGFEPLGSRIETGWFFNQHWVKSFPVGRILAMPQRDCFVSLFRLFHGDPWRVAFSTILGDGALVQTANQMSKVVIDQEGYFRWGCPSPDLAEVLRRHYLTVEDYRAARGLVVAAPNGVEAVCEAICRQSERYLRSTGLANGVKHLQTPLVFLTILTLAWCYYFGFDNWGLPASIVFGGVAYSVLLPFSIRSAARQSREADQEQGLAYHWAKQRRTADRHTPGGPQSQGVALDSPRNPLSDAITPPGQPGWSDDRIKGDSGPRGQ